MDGREKINYKIKEQGAVRAKVQRMVPGKLCARLSWRGNEE
jgi:hypothetical protein